jgi:hypothetical protein
LLQNKEKTDWQLPPIVEDSAIAFFLSAQIALKNFCFESTLFVSGKAKSFCVYSASVPRPYPGTGFVLFGKISIKNFFAFL